MNPPPEIGNSSPGLGPKLPGDPIPPPLLRGILGLYEFFEDILLLIPPVALATIYFDVYPPFYFIGGLCLIDDFYCSYYYPLDEFLALIDNGCLFAEPKSGFGLYIFFYTILWIDSPFEFGPQLKISLTCPFPYLPWWSIPPLKLPIYWSRLIVDFGIALFDL